MSAPRGDAELASVMRKLLDRADFVAIDAHGQPTLLTVDDTSVEITEDEHHAIEEALS